MKTFIKIALAALIAFAVGYSKARSKFEQQIYPSASFEVYRSTDGNYIKASGTWVVLSDNEDKQFSFPINSSEITCFKDKGVCVDASLFFSRYNGKLLPMARKDDWIITQWGLHEVTAEQTNDCYSQTLTISTITQEVFSISRNNSKDECKIGMIAMPKLSNPLVHKLVDGYDFARAYYEGKDKEYIRSLNKY